MAVTMSDGSSGFNNSANRSTSALGPTGNNARFGAFGRVHDQVIVAVTRLTPRERMLIGAMAVVGMVLAPMWAFDRAQTALAHYSELQSQKDAQTSRAPSTSSALTKRVDDQYRAMDRWAWAAPSVEVGQVMLQQSLSVMALEAGLKGVEVHSANGVKTVGRLQFVRVDLTAQFEWPAFTQFLQRLDQSGKGFQIHAIAVEKDRLSQLRLSIDFPLVVRGMASE